MTDTDFRGELLKRRCAASGWLSVGGFTFSFLWLQFDRSTDSPAVFGIYALAVGVLGFVTYKIRHCLCRAAKRRERRLAGSGRILLGGGIR